MHKTGLIVKNDKRVSLEDISGLLESAWQGSAYWATAKKYIAPTKWEFESAPKAEEGKHYPQDYALNKGGAVVIEDMESDGEVYRLSLPSIRKGLEVMAEKFPRHWSDFIGENYDMETGDVFLQCCLLGDVIYG